MNVKELKAELDKFPDDEKVILDSMEDGYISVTSVRWLKDFDEEIDETDFHGVLLK
jgi:hypothetical protein